MWEVLVWMGSGVWLCGVWKCHVFVGVGKRASFGFVWVVFVRLFLFLFCGLLFGCGVFWFPCVGFILVWIVVYTLVGWWVICFGCVYVWLCVVVLWGALFDWLLGVLS